MPTPGDSGAGVFVKERELYKFLGVITHGGLDEKSSQRESSGEYTHFFFGKMENVYLSSGRLERVRDVLFKP